MATGKGLKGDAAARLLHDAAEAYIGDIPSPIKNSIYGFRMIESCLLRAIENRFSLPLGSLDSEEIKKSDLIMLATEQRDLMSLPETPWKWKGSRPKPMNEIIVPWDHDKAEKLFMETAYLNDVFCRPKGEIY
jgi:hypothetical protein